MPMAKPPTVILTANFNAGGIGELYETHIDKNVSKNMAI